MPLVITADLDLTYTHLMVVSSASSEMTCSKPIIWLKLCLASEEESRCLTSVRSQVLSVCYIYIGVPGVTFSKVPRKILGKHLILGATDTQVATSSEDIALLLNIVQY